MSAAGAAMFPFAWRLHPLLLILFLFSVMPRGALSRGLALPPLPAPVVRNITCNSIPYPFGVQGRSIPGFEVACGENKEAMLNIDDEHSYKIVDVSVEGAFVVVLAGPISQVCYDRNGKQTQTTEIDGISLERTPFSFSRRNKLVVTGCNYMLVANFSNSSAGDTPWLTTTCFSYCYGSPNAVVDCLYGLACCEASMPMVAAREFNFTFNKTSGGNEDDTCNAAFFLDQDDQVFIGGRDDGQRPLKDVLLPAGNRRMVLDWAVGRGTCNQASNYNLAPCNSMSGCIDASSGAGYLCRCNRGYEGNPYAADGCLI